MKNYDAIESDDLYDMALEWIRYKEYDKAEHILKRAIELNPHFIYAYITLAHIISRKKNYSEAISVLKKASKTIRNSTACIFSWRKCLQVRRFLFSLKYIDRALDARHDELYSRSRRVIQKKNANHSR